MDWIKSFYEAVGIDSPKLFVLAMAVAGFVLFGIGGVVMVRAHQVQQKHEQEKAKRAEALSGGPYLIIEFSPTNRGPSGFSLRNDGQQNAVRVHINDITIKGRTARFGEIASVRNSGQAYGTYPEHVYLPPGATRTEPTIWNDLRDVFDFMSPGEETQVTVEYWEANNMRQYRTVALFKREDHGGVSLLTTRREIVSE